MVLGMDLTWCGVGPLESGNTKNPFESAGEEDKVQYLLKYENDEIQRHICSDITGKTIRGRTHVSRNNKTIPEVHKQSFGSRLRTGKTEQ